jgi:hypothetical protein
VLGRLGSGRSQQRHHVRNRISNRTARLHPCQRFLYGRERHQSACLAQIEILLGRRLDRYQQVFCERPLLVDPLDLAAEPRRARHLANVIERVLMAALGPDSFIFLEIHD